MAAGPVFNQYGQLVGIFSNNTIMGPKGIGVAYVRNGDIYSYASEYLGRLETSRGNLIWVE